MSKAVNLKRIGAPIVYRDRVDGIYRYVRGEVRDFRSPRGANRDWGQNWSHQSGTVFAIEQTDDVDEPRLKFRHISSCLTPEQFEAKQPVGVST
jgi:hypothetical protein